MHHQIFVAKIWFESPHFGLLPLRLLLLLLLLLYVSDVISNKIGVEPSHRGEKCWNTYIFDYLFVQHWFCYESSFCSCRFFPLPFSPCSDYKSFWAICHFELMWTHSHISPRPSVTFHSQHYKHRNHSIVDDIFNLFIFFRGFFFYFWFHILSLTSHHSSSYFFSFVSCFLCVCFECITICFILYHQIYEFNSKWFIYLLDQ